MAKLAVLISTPKKYITHCPASGETSRFINIEDTVVSVSVALDTQGVVRSERRTPFSRASCFVLIREIRYKGRSLMRTSRVMGMKDPKNSRLSTWLMNKRCSTITYPSRISQTLLQRSHMHTILTALSGLSDGCPPRYRLGALKLYLDPYLRGLRSSIVHRQPRRKMRKSEKSISWCLRPCDVAMGALEVAAALEVL